MADPQHGERRQAPRFSVVARILGHILSHDAPAAVLDLSTGGFLMQSAVQLPVDTVEEFRLTSAYTQIVVRARVVRSTVSIRSDGQVYITGLAFINLDQEQRLTIERLIGAVSPGD
jgi:hypothetical protein